MSTVFKFKQFEVDQEGCAMKINTDGVLLAALLKANAVKRVLDIGTGTGVLALMMAQRFPEAFIEAVEIDAQAAQTAEKNFQSSVFKARLSINNIAIEQYNNSNQFDLILSNPPFFVNDLKNTELKKSIARHAGNHFFDQLLTKINELLTDRGSFWFILPIKQAELLVDNALDIGFFVQTKILLHSDESKSAFRWIVALSRMKTEIKTEHLYIYQSEKVYTESYKQLLKPYFLNY